MKDYNDNLGTPLDAVKWYQPRFAEMKRVLKNTGLLYIQCDYNLSHYIKVELDNIFGKFLNGTSVSNPSINILSLLSVFS